MRRLGRRPASSERARAGADQRGFALIAVLLVLAFVAVIGAEFAYSMRLEATAARAYKETLVAGHLAEAGLEQAIREIAADYGFVGLGDDKDPGADPLCPLVFYRRDRSPIAPLPRRNVPLGAGHFSYCLTDEEARLNLNTAPPDRVGRLLEALGLEKADRDVVSDSLLDWRDGNDEHRLNGAESEDTYLNLAVPYRARNGRLESVAELFQIKGITPALLEGAEGKPGLLALVTVTTPGQININTMGPEVARALGLADAAFTNIEQTRRSGIYVAVPGQFGGRNLAVSSRTFRIEAEGLIDGQVRARLTAVVQRRLGSGGERISVLEWSGIR
jgi:general secretion pathway protein K